MRENIDVVLVRLLIALGAAFGLSIPHASLRNAMLALAELRLSSGSSLARVDFYYIRAFEELSVKNSTETNEADIFGAFLLCGLYDVRSSSGHWFNLFAFSFKHFISAINHLNTKSEGGVVSTSLFWPYARLQLMSRLATLSDLACSINFILQL